MRRYLVTTLFMLALCICAAWFALCYKPPRDGGVFAESTADNAEAFVHPILSAGRQLLSANLKGAWIVGLYSMVLERNEIYTERKRA